MIVRAFSAVFAGAVALTGCSMANALNPSDILFSDKHVAKSAVEHDSSPTMEAASDDDTNGFGYHIPSFCGKQSTYMLTANGEVYQLFLPQTDQNMNSSGINPMPNESTLPAESTAYCMIPLPYLPAGVDWTSNRPKRRMGSGGEHDQYDGNYDGLGATKSGALFAVSNLYGNPNVGVGSGGHSLSFTQPNKAQVYYLSANVRRQHAQAPNPRPSAGATMTTSYWTKLGTPIDLSKDHEYVSGGAASPDGYYYLMAVHPGSATDNGYIDFYKTNSKTNPTAMKHAGRLSLSTLTSYGKSEYPRDADGDMEFINGNLVVYLSWIDGTSDTGYSRIVRRIAIPGSIWNSPSVFNYSSQATYIPGIGLGDYLLQTNNIMAGVSNTSNSSEFDSDYNWQLEGVASDNPDNSGTGVFASLLNSGIFGQTPSCTTIDSNGQDCHYSQIPDMDPGDYDDGSGNTYGDGYPGVRIYSFDDTNPHNSNYPSVTLNSAMHLPYMPPRTYTNTYRLPNGSLLYRDHLPTNQFGNDYEQLWSGGSTDYYETTDIGNHPPIYYLYNGSITDLAKGGSSSTPPTPPTHYHYYGNLQLKKVDGNGHPLDHAKFVLWREPASGCGKSSDVPSSPLMTEISGFYPDHFPTLSDPSDPSSNPNKTHEHNDGIVKFAYIPLTSDQPEQFCYAEVKSDDATFNATYRIDSTPRQATINPGAAGAMGDGVSWTDLSGQPIVNEGRYYGNLQLKKVDENGHPLDHAKFVLWRAPADATDCGDKSDIPSHPLMTAISGYYPAHYSRIPNPLPSTYHGDGLVKFANIPFTSHEEENFCYAEVASDDSTFNEKYQIDSTPHGITFGPGDAGVSGDKLGWADLSDHPIQDPLRTGSITIGKYTSGILSTLSSGTPLWYYDTFYGGSFQDSNAKSVGSLPGSTSAIALKGSRWSVTGPDGTVHTVGDCTQNCTASGIADSDATVGVLKIKNLPLGTYTIREARAPFGYLLDKHSFSITIGTSQPPQRGYNGRKMDWTLAFGDKMATGPSLPFTGGLSTQFFQLVALTLLVLALLLATALWIKRKGGQRVK